MRAWLRRHWRPVFGLLVGIYILGPQPHFEWADGYLAERISYSCRSDRRLVGTGCYPPEPPEGRFMPFDPFDYQPATVITTPVQRLGHRHVALSLSNPHVRIFSVDFATLEVLGFGVCAAECYGAPPRGRDGLF